MAQDLPILPVNQNTGPVENINEVEESGIDIEKIEHEIGMLRLVILRDLRRYLHTESKRANDYHHGQLKLYANSFRSVLPLVLNGLSCTAQASTAFIKLSVPLADSYSKLSGLNISTDVLNKFADGTTLADSVCKTFKEFAQANLDAKRAESGHDSAKSLADFITQTYKKYQQDENDLQRELDQREGRKHDFDSSMARSGS